MYSLFQVVGLSALTLILGVVIGVYFSVVFDVPLSERLLDEETDVWGKLNE